MKYIKQLSIILFISFIGEMLSKLIPFTIPGSVYGIVILFAALATGILKLEKIEKTADFLLAVMPLLFVPAGAGLMTVWDKISANALEIIVITVVSTVVVMAVTGIVAQGVMKKDE